MDVERDDIRSAEEEWIAKYRAAVSKVGPPRTRWTQFRAILDRVRELLSSTLAGLVARSKKEFPPGDRLVADPKSKPLQVSFRRATQPIPEDGKSVGKAG